MGNRLINAKVGDFRCGIDLFCSDGHVLFYTHNKTILYAKQHAAITD